MASSLRQFTSSYPIDHYDEEIRCAVNGVTAVQAVLKPFMVKDISPKTLRQLGDSLAPSRKDEASAKATVDRVVQMLHDCPDISVHRCCLSGSIGKSTAVVRFDIDLVIFVNNFEPPFQDVLHHLEGYIPNVLRGAEVKKTTRFSVQFVLDGFHVDLLPAQNLVSDTTARIPREDQYLATLEKVSSLPQRERQYWSAAFSESIVHFMKQKQPFVNAAVRLCKLWKQTCRVTSNTFPSWFTSFLIEIIAVDAAQREMKRNPHSVSLVNVLKTFLKRLSSPQTLKVNIAEKYTERDIPQEVLRQRPLVMDPVNPFNNVAARLRDWTTIRILAQETLSSLRKANPTVYDIFGTRRLGEDLPRLFECCNFHIRFVKQGSFLRSLSIEKIADLNGAKMNPGVEWRKSVNVHHCSPSAQTFFLNMLDCFVNITTASMLHQVDVAINEGKREVQASAEYLDEVLYHAFGHPKVGWVPAHVLHEDCDVSLTFGQIPIPSDPNDLRYIFLKVSFDFNEESLYHLAYQLQRDIDRQAETM